MDQPEIFAIFDSTTQDQLTEPMTSERARAEIAIAKFNGDVRSLVVWMVER